MADNYATTDIFKKFPVQAPYSGSGEYKTEIIKEDLPYTTEVDVVETKDNVAKKAQVEKDIIQLKAEQNQDIVEKYKDFIPTQRFTIGKKDYLVMDASKGFEGLLPYEQMYILQDQGIDTSDSKFDSIKKEAEEYRQGNVQFPGYTDAIPYYPTDPRYEAEYKAQVQAVNDAALKQSDPINYYTGGYLDRDALKSFGAVLAPILTQAGRQFFLGGMTAEAIPGLQVPGAGAMAVGGLLTFAGMYTQGLIASGAGSAAMGQVYDNINRVLRGDFKGFGDVDENTKNALRDFYSEILWTGGADSLAGTARYMGPAGFKALMSLGSYQSKTLQKYADELGINLAPIHFSNDITKGTAKILGVFPVLQRTFKAGGEAGQKELLNFMNSYIGTYGPVMSLNNIGVNALKVAKGNKKLGMQAVEQAYKLFDDMAAKVNVPVVKGNNMMAVLDESITSQAAKAASEAETQYFNQLLQIQNSQYFRPALDEMKNLISKQGGLTVTQARGFQKKLNEAMGEYIKKSGKTEFTNEEATALLKFKEALEKDIQSIRVEDFGEQYKEMGGRMVDTLNKANNLYMKWASDFVDAPAARVFANADLAYKLNLGSDIYKPTKSSQQKFYKSMFETMKEDPDAMKGFKEILGEKDFNSAMGSWINDAYAESFAKGIKRDKLTGSVLMDENIKSNVFDPIKFSEKLGLDTPQGVQALEAAIGPEKVTTIQKFIDLAKSVDEITVGDPSTFVGRRVTFEGMKGLAALGSFATAGVGTAAIAAGGVGAIVAGVTKLLLAYGAFCYINNPKNLSKLVKWYEQYVGAKTLSRKALAEAEQLYKDAGIPTEAEDLFEYQQALQMKNILEGYERKPVAVPGSRQSMTNQIIEKKNIEKQETLNTLDQLAKLNETTTSMPTDMQTNIFQAPPGLTGSSNAATYASLFPFDTTGQQAAMSMEQRPRIAAQGGLGALLGFKGAN